MVRFNLLKTYWWSPFVTTALIGGTFFFLLPSIALLALNSRGSMLGIMFLGCLGFPWIMGKLHQISSLPIAMGFYLIIVAGWFFQPASFDGNPKLALATYLIPWIMTALIVNLVISIVLLRKRLPV